jgi:hypothetical protein
MPKSTATREEREVFLEVLAESIGIIEGEGIPWAVFGSIAARVHGRPGPTEDIDFLVRPEDANSALEAFARAGFETEETNPRWIFKAIKNDVLVDLIFKIKGDIYLDDEMTSRVREGVYEGHKLPVVAPEDAIVIAAASNDTETPEHWFNALSIIANQEIDWDYLRRRARHSMRRVLSLLIYAQANDLVVPAETVRALFDSVQPPLYET